MRVFLTGATGFIGSALVPELLAAGHEVTGLARSGSSADALIAMGAAVHHGSLEDPDSLRAGASQSDATIHCAYDHDFSKPEEISRKEAQAIAALGEGLEGSSRPLIITSGVGMGAGVPGQPATEDGYNAHNPRVATEIAGAAAAARGVNLTIVRLSQIHNTVKQGFVSYLIVTARATGVSAYIGNGQNRWAAAHVLDTARLYRLALERHEPGSRYHAAAEEGIAMRTIAEAIGETLGLPVKALSEDEAAAHFGWSAMFVGMDMSASSAITREQLGWNPTGPGLLEDLRNLR